MDLVPILVDHIRLKNKEIETLVEEYELKLNAVLKEEYAARQEKDRILSELKVACASLEAYAGMTGRVEFPGGEDEVNGSAIAALAMIPKEHGGTKCP